MSGLSVEFTPDLTAAKAAMNLSDGELEDVVFAIGELMVTQTKTRIADEKRDPDGTPWAPWSARYAATRSGGHSLLRGEGHLADSIANHSRGLEAIAGTNLVYAAAHQFGLEAEDGSGGLPAREYLGLSVENRREIEELLVHMVEADIR